MGHLLYLRLLVLRQTVEALRERREGVVGRACLKGQSALKAVRIVGHDTIERVGRATHHDVPQQFVDVHVDGLCRLRLAVVGRAVVGLSQHDGEVAHRRAPLLRDGVGLGCEGEGMLALGVGQSVGKVGHGGVERQPAHGILRVLGLLLLVLGRPLSCAPFLLGLQIALVHHFHLRE